MNKVVKFNVNGLNKKNSFNTFEKLQIDIDFIQETHLTSLEHKKMRREWVGHVISSSFNPKARGLTVLINKNTPVTFGETIVDPFGRYILVIVRFTQSPGLF